jgi:hypothetical protein
MVLAGLDNRGPAPYFAALSASGLCLAGLNCTGHYKTQSCFLLKFDVVFDRACVAEALSLAGLSGTRLGFTIHNETLRYKSVPDFTMQGSAPQYQVIKFLFNQKQSVCLW